MLAESRREKFLNEFTQSYKYTEIKARLQEAIFRLGVEKFKKQYGGSKKLDDATKNKFKAELYIFLQKKLKDCLTEAISNPQSALPQDIVSQFEQHRDQQTVLQEQSFKESTADKHTRLANEFSIICDVENTEREFVNMLIANPTDADKWYEFALFSLKFGMQAKAE
jgi:hypothetical protein